MKTIIISFSLLFINSFTTYAGFGPLSLKEKCEKSDIIIHAKVISVTRIMPKDDPISHNPIQLTVSNKGHYYGASSIALVSVIKYIKNTVTKSMGKDIPKFIMIPCDYSFSESPSDLTKNREYIMFLSKMGSNLFHPLDPASTHVVFDKRVRMFGMNHPAINDPDFKKDSITYDLFIKNIKKFIKK
jgi:hypothetical protein